MKISRRSKIKKCPVTRKTMFNKQSQAQYAMMRTISHDPNADMFNLHTYVCPDCGKWHFGNRKWFEMQKVGDNIVSATVAK